jgi:hypothetical protein
MFFKNKRDKINDLIRSWPPWQSIESLIQQFDEVIEEYKKTGNIIDYNQVVSMYKRTGAPIWPLIQATFKLVFDYIRIQNEKIIELEKNIKLNK